MYCSKTVFSPNIPNQLFPEENRLYWDGYGLSKYKRSCWPKRNSAWLLPVVALRFAGSFAQFLCYVLADCVIELFLAHVLFCTQINNKERLTQVHELSLPAGRQWNEVAL